jgi:hypothetical protein
MATAPAAATFMNHLSSQEPRTVNTTKTLVAAAIALASFASSAQVTTGLGSFGSSFLTLSSSNVMNGAIYNASQTFTYAVRPTNSSPSITTVGNWGAVAGTQNTNTGGGVTATLNLPNGASRVSFLWGSPDTFNQLIVNTDAGSKTFTAAALGLNPNSATNAASYVNFTVSGGAKEISSLTFVSSTNAFEFSNVSAVPEPGTYAMLLSGLMAVGFVARRRRAQSAGQPTPALG